MCECVCVCVCVCVYVCVCVCACECLLHVIHLPQGADSLVCSATARVVTGLWVLNQFRFLKAFKQASLG